MLRVVARARARLCVDTRRLIRLDRAPGARKARGSDRMGQGDEKAHDHRLELEDVQPAARVNERAGRR